MKRDTVRVSPGRRRCFRSAEVGEKDDNDCSEAMLCRPTSKKQVQGVRQLQGNTAWDSLEMEGSTSASGLLRLRERDHSESVLYHLRTLVA
jgi:hypothetical protein